MKVVIDIKDDGAFDFAWEGGDETKFYQLLGVLEKVKHELLNATQTQVAKEVVAPEGERCQ